MDAISTINKVCIYTCGKILTVIHVLALLFLAVQKDSFGGLRKKEGHVRLPE